MLVCLLLGNCLCVDVRKLEDILDNAAEVLMSAYLAVGFRPVL